MNAGVPVVFLSNGQTKRYHTDEDEADSLDYPKITREAEWLSGVVARLGQASTTPTFTDDEADHEVEAQTLTDVLQAALAPDGLVDSLGLTAESRGNIQSDLDAVEQIATDLAGGGAATNSDVRALRTATQRLMCFAGSSYEEYICNYF